MIAISIPKRTIYDCDPFQKGANMIAIIEILFSRDSSGNHNHVTRGRISTLQSYLVLFEKDCNHIWSVLELRLQSYLLLFEKDCNHIWSVLELRLQSYQVPFVTNIAIMFGPHSNFVCNHMCYHIHRNYCNHKWSTRIPISFEIFCNLISWGF